jgi:FAD/FMN-containing dehydrogenase
MASRPASEFVADLRDALGPRFVRDDPDELTIVNQDWTGRFTGSAAVVVRPGDTSQVVAVIDACRRHGLPLVPFGGNTGLVGGTAAPPGAVALSTDRLDAVVDVDPHAGQLTAGAGATLAQVQQAARQSGWRYPVDFGARDSATVGGMVATNAGGVHVVRHGTTRRRLLGVEAVLGTGVVIRRLGGLIKDNTGYDLAGLLCGSEGTLGVITAARLALAPEPANRLVALLGFDGLPQALDAGAVLISSLSSIEAVELMLAEGLALVGDRLGLGPPPVAGRATLLVEAGGGEGLREQVAEVVAGLPGLTGTAVATEHGDRERLWRYRDGHTEAISRLGTPIKLDVTLPRPALERFLTQVGPAVGAVAAEAEVWLFGHMGDGNVHVNVTGVATDDGRVDQTVLDLVIRHGGSISAEHGVGRAKVDRLPGDRGHGDLVTFRAIKAACDPDGIMNPGALISPR